MIVNKQQCRELFLARRTAISQAEHQRLTESIARRLLDLLSSGPIGWLHSYVAEGFRNEVNTTLIRQIVNTELPLTGHASVRWVAPRMIPGSHHMTHHLWDDDTLLVHNRWGIPEPDPVLSPTIEPAELDAVLVPLLGYDARGHRVGYGGGYYDRFLAECRPEVIKIGLSFFEPIEAIQDLNEWDVQLDLCITPDEVYRWIN